MSTYEVAVTAEDALGNPTVDATSNELVIDTTGPTAPTVNTLTTSDTTPTISGTFDETDGTVTQVVVNGVTYLSSGSDLTVDGGTGRRRCAEAWHLTAEDADGGCDQQRAGDRYDGARRRRRWVTFDETDGTRSWRLRSRPRMRWATEVADGGCDQQRAGDRYDGPDGADGEYADHQ